MAHGSMSKTLVLLMAAAIPVGYVIWLSQRHAQQKGSSPASSASAPASAESR